MGSSEQRWDAQPRVWRQAPPAWPLAGSWVLTAAIAVHSGRAQASIRLDGSQRRDGGLLKPAWASVPLKTRVPATYTEAIPLLSEALWELNCAFQGVGIRFEHR